MKGKFPCHLFHEDSHYKNNHISDGMFRHGTKSIDLLIQLQIHVHINPAQFPGRRKTVIKIGNPKSCLVYIHISVA